MTVIFLTGPTASGKTDLALEIVRRLPCEIISVDSAMVYRGMDIGTAKPDAALRRVAPHRLIDICDAAEPYSAARFRADALHEIAQVQAAGRVPLLVGGTMLYFRALERGLSAMPAADAELRARLELEGKEQGWPALHARLASIDPRAAARIHPHDPQRIQRALEVFELTGCAMSELQDAARAEPMPFSAVKIHVLPSDRAALHRNIEQRFHRMMEQGLLGEVEALHRRGDLDPLMPSLRTVGYRQLWQCVTGQVALEQAVCAAIAATRQLARRQLNWLRSETVPATFAVETPGLVDNVLKFIATALRYPTVE
ncbi:MAG: tRNA (adenosine(37)-N6)-dimethylallyltransferase MiaA [Chromatiales bacterium]|nr:tRNA (adenosine(37)-N6)-dimethylallyltransferase MiaA [Chromatiales bacterium]